MGPGGPLGSLDGVCEGGGGGPMQGKERGERGEGGPGHGRFVGLNPEL